MKIALGQLHIAWEDKDLNLEKIEQYLGLLREEAADLFLLPEMSLTGFSMNTALTKEAQKETVTHMQALAKRYGIAIGCGWVKDAGELCENHYSLITPKGEILDYAKIHPFRYGGETAYFQGGTKLPVCEYKGYTMGVQICYDLRFPEPFQKLSKTCDLIIVPANWPAARRMHWMCLLQARAIENMTYIAGINCAGHMGGQYYEGDSGLYAPDGALMEAKVLRLEACVPKEQVLVYELKKDVHSYRKQFPVKDDRREDLYSIL